MTDDIVLEARRNKVAHLTMNRPGARNSLSKAMLERLHSAIVDLGKAHDVYVIVINANGPGFCAGHDLKELTAARAQADIRHASGKPNARIARYRDHAVSPWIRPTTDDKAVGPSTRTRRPSDRVMSTRCALTTLQG